MLKAYEGLKVGEVVLRPIHVADAFVAAGLAQVYPSDSPVAKAVTPSGRAAGEPTIDDTPKPKRRRRKKKASD